MTNPFDDDDLDVPRSARWAVADDALEPLRERLAEAVARPADFAAGLWDPDERGQNDAAIWRRVCAEIGPALGDRSRLAEVGSMAEESGRAAASLPLLGSALVATLLADADAAATSDLDALRAGTPGALLWAGPTDAITLRFEPTGDGRGTLDGTVEFTVDGRSAELLVGVATGRDGELLVCRADGAVARDRRLVADPTRDLATISLSGTPATAVARGPGVGTAVERLDPMASTLIALDAVGAARAALEKAVAYAGEREQFGRKIGSYQAVAHHCATMYLLTENARSLARAAAWAVARDEPGAAVAAAAAKACATENAVEVGRLAIQVHGGIGMTWNNPSHVHYKRAWVDRALLGSARRQRERVVTALAAATTPTARPSYRTPF